MSYAKIITTAMLLCYISTICIAQTTLHNKGAVITIKTGAVLFIAGDFTNIAGSTFKNDGTVTVTGKTTNNQTMATPASGTLTFNGTTAQSLEGAATYYASNVVINNSAGVTLNTPLKVDGSITFTDGNITATSTNPITFTSNGTHSGTSNSSHINGYAVKEGTGNFIYPVGDGTNYQPVGTNLSANSAGMKVNYTAGDAGSGTFSTAGTVATALKAYNASEYWNLTPVGTAAGTVTISWDSYNNTGITSVSHLQVAHLSGGDWLNEGTSGSGTVSAGSVTSNSVSTWSPFTLGSLNASSPLPVNWIHVSGKLNNQKQARLYWQVQEHNVEVYEVEKSSNGSDFDYIGSTKSIGDGLNSYTFTDVQALNETTLYRVKQVDYDGTSSYSSVIKLQSGSLAVNAYPNPTTGNITISGEYLGNTATLTDATGKILVHQDIFDESFTIDLSNNTSGIYLLKMDNGVTHRIVKQ